MNQNKQNNEIQISDTELEMEFISRLLFDPDLIKEAYGKIKPDDLLLKEAKTLYKMMLKFHEDKEQWDLSSVYHSLKDKEHYHNIVFRQPLGLGLRGFKILIKTLRKSRLKYDILVLAEKAQRDLVNKEPEQVITDQLTQYRSIETHLISEEEWSMENSLKRHSDLMEKRYSGDFQGVLTGFPMLDSALVNGIQKKDLVIVGARPSVGKTSFSLSVALNAAQRGSHTLFISCEMDDTEVFDRLIGFILKAPVSSIARGKIDKKKMDEAYQIIKKLPLTIIHTPKATSADVYSLAVKQKNTDGLDLLIVDYLGYLADEDTNEVIRVGKISRSLKTTANLLDCAVIAPHQLSRGIEHRKKDSLPMLSDLRDSGHVEQDADVIMFLNRDVLQKGERVTLRIAKNRTGQTATIDLRFSNITTRFEP